MKTVFALVVTAIVLVGCGSSSDVEVAAPSIPTTEIETPLISLSLPADWVAATGAQLPSIGRGSIAGAWTSTELRSGIANSLVIIQDTLAKKVSSLEYSLLNHTLTLRSVKKSTLIESKEIVHADGDTSRLYLFEAQYNDKTPSLLFIQATKVCGDSVFVASWALSPGTPNTTDYEQMSRSLRCH